MAFVPDTPADLEAAQLASYSTRFQGRDTHSESFLGKLARAEAQGLWNHQKKLQRISLDSVPNTNTSYERLADWASALGLENGDDGFGPLVATPATGLVGTATGTPAAPIANGLLLVAPDGLTQFEVVNGPYAIGGGGSVSIDFNAVTAGTAGNLQTPSTLTFVSPPAGVSASVTLTQGSSNGTDQESKPDLLARILERLQNPPRGGTQADWNVWARAVSVLLTINRSYGYARRNGTGTVDEVVTYEVNAAGDGTSRQVSNGDLTNIRAYVNTVRPVTVEGFRILTPNMPTANKLQLRTRITAYPAGSFDWSSNTLGLTVAAYTPGSPAVLQISADAPSDLVAAVDAGTEPRLQVIATSGTIVPTLVRVTAYGGAGNRDLTLEDPLPDGFVAPTVGDAVYSGGPAVVPIATDQLAYVNQLGPSRLSGYADPDDAWNDTVETAQLSRVALDAVDDSDQPLALNIVKIAGVFQVLIKVGVGAFTTDDYQTTDNGTDAPECARVVNIAVTD